MSHPWGFAAAAVLTVGCVLAACGDGGAEKEATVTPSATMTVTSDAFQAQGTIPTQHTCDGADQSPPLAWKGAPANTRAFAIIMDDPDAPVGTWVHWVAYNLPAETARLAAGDSARLPAGSRDGKNSWGRAGYGGPCPPKGAPHHYSFRVYALDATLDLAAGASKGDVEKAMASHVLAAGELVGLFGH